jgi:hypothetical protein
VCLQRGSPGQFNQISQVVTRQLGSISASTLPSPDARPPYDMGPIKGAALAAVGAITAESVSAAAAIHSISGARIRERRLAFHHRRFTAVAPLGAKRASPQAPRLAKARRERCERGACLPGRSER